MKMWWTVKILLMIPIEERNARNIYTRRLRGNMDVATMVTSWKLVLVIINPVPTLWRSGQSTAMDLCIIVSYNIKCSRTA
jgi:hypothetical protein